MNTLITRILLLLLTVSLTADAFAQDGALYLSSQQQPIRMSFGALYQSYSDNNDQNLTELSIPLTLSVPLGQRFGVSLIASQASASGDSLDSVSGISDVQVGLSYYQEVGEGSVVVSLGANLPSGKQELTTEEFATSIFLSQHYYNFRVPSFGQGLNLAPGIVLAFPAGDNVVLGVGVSYQLRGSYTPIEGQPDYEAGDELLLTGGFDYRVSRTANLSADVTFTRYSSDTFNDQEVYSAGNKITTTAQWLSYLGANELRLLVRYRSLAKSTRPAVLGAVEEELRVLPAQLLLRGAYRHRVSTAFVLGVLARARLFGETDVFESTTLLDLGLTPEIALSQKAVLRTRFVYTFGDFTGFDVGGGLAFAL